MKIFANIRREVDIDPITVLKNLIYDSIQDGWIVKENDVHYKYFEVCAGSSSFEDKEVIDEDLYTYIQSLQYTINYLIEKNKKILHYKIGDITT